MQSDLPIPSELERRVEEADRLGEVGRSLESFPTWQLAQMAVEAEPSMSGGGSQLARSSDLPWEARPTEGFLWAAPVKKP